MLYENILSLIGSTPMLRLNEFEKQQGIEARLYAKLECFNPTGSVKDRAALNMIRQAEKDGKLEKGSTIIEPTSGNTGIGLAMVAIALGYKLILTMPESMSLERRQLLSAYGAELVLTPASEGMSGAVKAAEELAAKTPKSFIPSQFDNPANPESHATTAKEILADVPNCDVFVACFGTGGTVSGTAKYLKAAKPNIKIIAVEPAASPLVTQGRAGSHKIQGIGANFVPKNLDLSLVDEIMTVSDEDAYAYTKLFAQTEGLLVGISSGAALAAANEAAQKNKGKSIVVLLPDGGSKYLSCGVFD